MARLIIRSGGQPEQTVELGAEAVTIGREPGNTVVLPGESKASRRHCQVAPISGGGTPGWELIDLQSTNGTRVNGQAIKRQRLMPGDVIDIGLTKIHFDDAAAAAAREATPNVCYLEYTAGSRRGERVALSGPRTTLGRRETNTIVLDDRMASGHHAEIVRDLNGYTIRDLGSTNGTLVNGEPVTELLLVHGARIRVGNARLVFKDPTMKDVEVALAGLDEDDGGWGMMADVDLTKVRRGGVGSLVGALAVVALAIAAFFVLAQNKSGGAAAVDADASNWIQDPHFEAAELPWWSVDEGSPASTERSANGGPKGSSALVVRHDPSKAVGGAGTGLGVAHYNADLQISESSAYRVGGAIKKDGPGRGELGIQWIRLANPRSGATAVTQTTRVSSAGSSWSTASVLVRRPRWAESGRLVVVAGPETSVRVDDVRFEPADGETGGGRLDAGDVEGTWSSAGSFALVRTATVLAVGAAPFARLADGRAVGGPSAFVAENVPSVSADSVTIAGKLLDEKGEGVPGQMTWSKFADGLSVSVSVPGAASTGIAFDVPVAHLEDGLGVLGSFGSKKLGAEPGASVEGARKLLLGDPRGRERVGRPPTLFAIASAGGDVLKVESAASDDVDLLRLRVSVAGEKAQANVVTGFSSERALAAQNLRAAELKAETSVGESIQELLRVAQEFPFQEDVRARAIARAQALQEKTRTDLRALDDVAVRFSVLGSEDALADLEKRAADLARQFPAERASAGTLEQTVAAQIAAARAARWKFDADRAGPEIRRLTKLAGLLEVERGFEVEAAAYYDSIVRRYERLATEQPESEIGRQVDEAKKKRDELLQKPEVRASWPGEVPGGGGAPASSGGTNTRTSAPVRRPDRSDDPKPPTPRDGAMTDGK